MRVAVVTAATGLRVARRSAHPHAEADLRVTEPAPVLLPDAASLDAHTLEGALWRRLWTLSERLVVEYTGIAVIEVRHSDGTVTFDRDLAPDVEDHLLLDHVLPLVLADRGALVLHGAVVRHDRDGVVLVGSSGAGKSTLTAWMSGAGWSIGGDDGAVVTAGSPSLVEPTYRSLRLTEDAVSLLGMPADVGTAVAGKRRLPLPEEEPSRAVLRLVAAVQPGQGGSQARFTRLRGVAALELLLGQAFHVDLGGARLGLALEQLARTAESAVIGTLSVPRGRDGLAGAEAELRQALAA